MKECSTRIRLISLPLLILYFSFFFSLTCQGSQQFNLLIEYRQHQITGICIIQTTSLSSQLSTLNSNAPLPSEGSGEVPSIVGTVMNEFGTKFFDFTYSNGKTRVFNLIKPINKWYIRRALRRDFQFILTNINENGITLKRKRIKYTLTPLISQVTI